MAIRARRIFWKLYPSYLAVTLLALLAVYLFLSSAVRRFYERQVAIDLQLQARLIEERTADLFASAQIAVLEPVVLRLAEKIPARITLLLRNGTVVGDSDKEAIQMGNHRDRPEIAAVLAGGQPMGRAVRYSNTLRQRMMYVAVPVRGQGAILGVARLAMPLTEIEQMIAAVQRQIGWGASVILIWVAGLCLLVSRRISQPLERIKRGAERFAQGDFSQRFHPTRVAEINAVVETMNQMAEQLEERLQTVTQERNQREAILSSMVEGVFAVDTSGRILSLNQAAEQFFCVASAAPICGRLVSEVFRNATLQNFVAEVLEGQQTRECELVVSGAAPCYLQARGTNLFGLHGRRMGALIVLNDVSRLRHLEAVRREFVANVSHELKTPITSIKGFVETLLDGALRDASAAEHFLTIVAKHADRLNAIIDDLLVLSRLEQEGAAKLDFQPVGLEGLMRSAVEACHARAVEKEMAVQIDAAPQLIARVNPPLIEQALINLISNAIKYSPRGKTIWVRADRNAAGTTTFSVRDQGFGIESEHIDRLFERFYRVDKGRSRQEGGTGLGLAIVKHIAQAHRGRVAVESQYGVGSTFSMSIPARD